MDKKEKMLLELADDLIIDLYLLLQNIMADDEEIAYEDVIKAKKCHKYLADRGIELK